MKVHDKKYHNYSNYIDEIFSLNIDSFSYQNAGFVRKVTLCDKTEFWEGDTIEELIKIFEAIIKWYDLKEYTKNSKDVLLVYTDNLVKAKGFLQPYITENFELYFQILNFIEIRPIDNWKNDLDDPKEIQKYAQWLYDTLFKVDGYVYLSPNQAMRKRVMKEKDTLAKTVCPKKFIEYDCYRSGLFGGINFVAYPKITINRKMLALDIKSAYPFTFLVRKHCISEKRVVDKNTWKSYIGNKEKGSFGFYKIWFDCDTTVIDCYKDKYGIKLQKGLNQYAEILLDNIDLEIFTNLTHINKIECIFLHEYDLGYIPKFLLDIIVEQYLKKESLQGEEKALQKTILNGLFGNCIRRLSKQEFINYIKNPAFAPQWGLWITSYTKQILLSLALKLDGWMYSATDSIYCLDTPNNRQLINEINASIMEETKAFCDKFGYDFDNLKKLGTFQIEAEIIKFRAFRHNQYTYITKDGKQVLKAGGKNKENIMISENLFDMDENPDMPNTTCVRSFILPDDAECEVAGRHYISHGYYYERNLTTIETGLYDWIMKYEKNKKEA